MRKPNKHLTLTRNTNLAVPSTTDLLPYTNLADVIKRECLPTSVRSSVEFLATERLLCHALNGTSLNAVARRQARKLLKKIVKANPSLTYLSTYAHLFDNCKTSVLANCLADIYCKLSHHSNAELQGRFKQVIEDILVIASFSLRIPPEVFNMYQDTNLAIELRKLPMDKIHKEQEAEDEAPPVILSLDLGI